MLSARSLCLFLAMFLTLGQALESFRAEDGYEVFPTWPGSRYKLNTLHLTWAEALTACQGDGGGSHLVILNSQEEAGVFQELFARITDSTIKFLAVGMDDIVTEGTWVTVQGTLVSISGYNLWEPGQPDNLRGNEDCGCASRTATFNDYNCTTTMPFVCEKPDV